MALPEMLTYILFLIIVGKSSCNARVGRKGKVKEGWEERGEKRMIGRVG